MIAPLTHQQFVDKANLIHNFKYEYPDPYIRSYIKINIICPIHGPFPQKPYSHLSGKGCKDCAKEYIGNLQRFTHDEFVAIANKIHNFQYRYPDPYKGIGIKINIECLEHGLFPQTPGHHIHSEPTGCPDCGGRSKKTTEQFIKQANEIHNSRYEYPDEYVNCKTDINIKCLVHGLFPQTPDAHINGQQGCPDCAQSAGSSKLEIEWLNSLNISKQYRQYPIIPESNIRADGYDPVTNTVYEFYGDYWHGHPRYNPQDINEVAKKTFQELYDGTMRREMIIKNAGYNLVTIWEFDWIKHNIK